MSKYFTHYLAGMYALLLLRITSIQAPTGFAVRKAPFLLGAHVYYPWDRIRVILSVIVVLVLGRMGGGLPDETCISDTTRSTTYEVVLTPICFALYTYLCLSELLW